MNKENIKKVRLECYMTQLEFSKEIGVSITTVNQWEVGVKKPRLRNIRKILQFCKDNNIEV
jgi:DNA-binding XRE family transcriptional regulator